MSTIPTPAQAAAARREKLAAEAAAAARTAGIADLKNRCIAVIGNYDGNDCVTLPLTGSDSDYVSAVEAELTGWSLYASKDGNLYLGEELQTGVIRTRDSLLPVTPVAEQPAVTLPPTAPAIDLDQLPVVPAQPKPAPAQPAEVAKRTFDVARVDRNTEALRTKTTQSVFGKLLQGDVESCSNPNAMLVDPYGFHGLVEVAHRAYEDHYGLVLSPDDIWVTIAQGFAKLVNQDPEAFRSKFVTHTGKKEIRIRRDQFVMGNPNNDWQGCFGDFSDAIRGYIGDEKHGIFVSDFTSTGPIQKTISEIVLMDTVQAYFEYVVETRCGIPFVTLRGSVEDWKKVAKKVRDLGQFGDLAWWLDELHPIMDQFVAAASGQVDIAFWNDLYKGEEGSGSIDMSGWILKLLPLTKKGWTEEWHRNPLLGTKNGVSRRDYNSGVTNSNLPGSLSNVPFIWDYLGQKFDYQFIGGIVGYSQSGDTLTPEMGWAVRPKPTAPAQRRRGW